MNLLNIDRTLSIMPTYCCNAECTDCGTLSNPRIVEKLSEREIVAAIEQASKIGFKNVVFTGGEATIYNDLLVKGIRKASKSGLKTRLVTNGVWAKTRQRADKKISEWIKFGLDELNLSTGDQHQRFVPMSFLKNAISAAATTNLRCLVMIEKHEGSHISKNTFLSDPVLKVLLKNRAYNIIESPWMPLDPNTNRKYAAGETATEKNLAGFGGCDSVLQTYVIGTDPGVYACCGIGARLIRELRSLNQFEPLNKNSLREIIFESEQDFLKLWIRTEGTEKILSWCSKKDKSISWEGQYAHKCQACLKIYSDPKIANILIENFSEKIPDVVFREFVGESLGNLVST